MFCSRCGFNDSRENARFCEKCGEGLPVATPGGQAGAAATYPQPPPLRAATVDPSGRRYAEGKNSVVALVLSAVLPAVGQIYNGDMKKCLAMWAAYFACTVIALMTGGVGGFLNAVVWVWSMIDAFNVASRKSPLW